MECDDVGISDRSSEPQLDPPSELSEYEVLDPSPKPPRLLLLSPDSDAEFRSSGSESDSSAGEIGQNGASSPSSERTLIMGEVWDKHK